MVISVPVFSGQHVPLRIRIMLALALTWIVLPLIPHPPRFELLSFSGVMVSIQQLFIGILSGYFLRIVFAAVVFSGQAIAYSMGLGFAAMVDPQTGVQVPLIAQFYMLITTVMFLGMDGHLLLIEMLLDSFQTIPISIDGISRSGIWTLIAYGGRIFAGGLLLALPGVFGLLLINMGFGVATRAAPQLNVFSVGFVATILLGLWITWLTIPVVLNRFSTMLGESYQALGGLLGT